MSGGPGLFRDAHDPAKRAGIRKGMRCSVLTGVFIASCNAGQVRADVFDPARLLRQLVRLLFLLPTVVRERMTAAQHWRTQRKYAMVVATISPISYVLVLYAMKATPPSGVGEQTVRGQEQ